jgi:hypothetical protein
LVSLRHLDDQIYESLNEDGTEDLPPTNSTLYMNMRFLETQLEDWKVNNSTLGMSKSKHTSSCVAISNLFCISFGLIPRLYRHAATCNRSSPD